MSCITCNKVRIIDRHRNFIEHGIVCVWELPSHGCTVDTKSGTDGIQRCRDTLHIKVKLSTTQYITILIEYLLVVHRDNRLPYNKVEQCHRGRLLVSRQQRRDDDIGVDDSIVSFHASTILRRSRRA